MQNNPYDATQLVTLIKTGLRSPQKRLPTQLLYDKTGSELFVQITQLPEYYPYLCEKEILGSCARNLKQHLLGRTALIELGSGASDKAEILLSQLPFSLYCAVDISRSALIETVETLRARFSNVEVQGVCRDFTNLKGAPLELGDYDQKVLFFPGSTIGNFEPAHAMLLLSQFRKWLDEEDLLIIGVDTKKDASVLHAAYNDKRGITARFNLNILEHVNRVSRANFSPADFEHRAFYNEDQSRIEMHLQSKKEHTVYVDNETYFIDFGETIHTENSYKYSFEGFTELAGLSGYSVVEVWKDSRKFFSVYVLRPIGNAVFQFRSANTH